MIQELIEEVEAMQLIQTSTPRRSGRKRAYHEEVPKTPAPKRKSKPTMLTGASLKRFYMNKSSARFARQALETIYEDTQVTKAGPSPKIGGSKIKRSINMDRILGMVTKQKKLSRKNKLKRLGLKPVKVKKLTDEEFKKRLKAVDFFIESCETSQEKEDVPVVGSEPPS